jgi:hypothetical protein
MGPQPMVHLTTAAGAFHGRVLAARLGAEGILAELRGATEGPYPNVGSVEVYVRASQVDEARQVLLADAIDAAFDEADEAAVAEAAPHSPGQSGAARPAWLKPALVVLAVLVVLALLGLARAV